jgi:hypothetical protein
MKFRRNEKLLPHEHAARRQRDLVAEFKNHCEVSCAQRGNDMLVRNLLVLIIEDAAVQEFSCSAIVKATFPTITAVVVDLATLDQQGLAAKQKGSAPGIRRGFRIGLYLHRVIREGLSRDDVL